jgi:hypothetical protein
MIRTGCIAIFLAACTTDGIFLHANARATSEAPTPASADAAGNHAAPTGTTTDSAPPGTTGTTGVSVAPAPTTGIYALPTERVTRWQPGVTYNGGIPARSAICSTLTPSGGNDLAQIQAALDACPANQTVKLGPGTFTIAGDDAIRIRKSNVTLRGSGAGVTRILRSDQAIWAVIVIGELWFKTQTPVALAADAAKGATAITLAANPGYAVGEIIYLHELPSSAAYLPSSDVYWGTHVGPPGDGTRRWFCEQDRPIGQALEITAIAGSTLTLAAPLHIAFETAQAAQVSRLSNGASVVPAVKWSGVEDLAVGNGGGGDGGGNIHVFASAYSWVKNVESYGSLGHSVNLDGCFRCEVRDSYVHSSRNPNPGGDGYALGVNYYASDSLFENNIVWNFNKMSVARSSGGGNVWGYNLMDDGWGQGYPTIIEMGAGPNHYATAHFELFEGNESFNFDTESFWGNSIYGTVFRNRFTGLRGNRQSAPTAWPGSTYPVPMALVDEHNRRMVGLQTASWNYNFVGNVLGFSGMPLVTGRDIAQTSFVYEADQSDVDRDDPVPCWKIGYDGTAHPTSADPTVLATLLRDGNYDFCSRSQRWHGIGGSGAGSAPSPLPVLPDSLYMTKKPSFFGARPWPWIKPETGETFTLPARERFDNGTPNTVP